MEQHDFLHQLNSLLKNAKLVGEIHAGQCIRLRHGVKTQKTAYAHRLKYTAMNLTWIGETD